MRGVISFAWGVLVGWWRDDVPRHGAALAYYAVFSMAPVLVLSIAVAGLVAGEETAREHLLRQLGGLVGERGREAIAAVLESASARPRQGWIAAWTGAATLLLGASAAFGQLQFSLNRIFRATAEDRPGWLRLLRARVISFSMVLVLGFLLLTSLVVAAAVAALDDVVGQRLPWLQPALALASLALSLGLETALFAAIFKVLPDCPVFTRDAWTGGFATALLFLVGKTAIGLYLGNTGIASSYGAASSVIVLLVWVYYSAQILLLGAELTRAVGERRAALRCSRESGTTG